MLNPAQLEVPPGRWLAAVSGGADSVAMLLACHELGCVAGIAHVDHVTRGVESAGDAEFVAALGAELNVPVQIVRRTEIEQHLIAGVPGAASSRYRLMRLRFYAQLIDHWQLAGVLMGHHADDQAETIFLRLLRGSGFEGLGGIRADATVEGVRICRPMLRYRKAELVDYLRAKGQPWREDASNTTPAYGRNRVREVLSKVPELVPALLRLGAAARDYQNGLTDASRETPTQLPVGGFSDLAAPDARHAARRFISHRVPADEIASGVIERFLSWAADAAAPSRINLPGGVTAVRSRGVIHLTGPEVS